MGTWSMLMFAVAATAAQPEDNAAAEPVLWKTVHVPEALRATATVDGEELTFGGDIRMGDLTGNGTPDFLVYRSVDKAHDEGGMKPCFLGAFNMEGEVLWTQGEGGQQPCRPGPVAIHDIDGDGVPEVVCLFLDPGVEAPPTSMANVVAQVRDGHTGEVMLEKAPGALRSCSGRGPNWCHQRLLMADFRGQGRPRDFVVKLGDELIAFDEHLNVLWTYTSRWTEYANCPAYIPSAGDIDGDGRDEVNGGYFLLDHDGTPMWEEKLGLNMDSVAITEWDHGNMRAICSGFGHVMDARGNVVLKLGKELVPHGQEVRVARFIEDDPRPQMVLRYNGHTPELLTVNTDGDTVGRIELAPTRNNTGMTVVYWNGPDRPALLYSGDGLWHPVKGRAAALPDLPAPKGSPRAGWYHCIPANVTGDEREEAVLYNPWDTAIRIYSPAPVDEAAFTGYAPGPRQYNVRLMD